ncbi:hypothetical protein ALP24_200101 [Pseudomonas syringae pv. aptata]|uniref:Uncharacterized protein n=1 Tax=Pseudomonas syringae pv. aptata TaxID=83167 RepID=A0A3M5WRW7_PSEAP|nr:hypothetical protein ALP24_200101 [Pseudomonas syringae pv. aptata]
MGGRDAAPARRRARADRRPLRGVARWPGKPDPAPISEALTTNTRCSPSPSPEALESPPASSVSRYASSAVNPTPSNPLGLLASPFASAPLASSFLASSPLASSGLSLSTSFAPALDATVRPTPSSAATRALRPAAAAPGAAPAVLPTPAAFALVTKTCWTFPAPPPTDPLARFIRPLPILNAPKADLATSRAPMAPVSPIARFGILSLTVVMPWATVFKPCATASVAGLIASPTLRMASLAACESSAHFCDEPSRRSARFLSRMPDALRDCDFRSLYSCLFCRYAVSAALTCMSAKMSPVFKACDSDSIIALALAGSVSLLILAVAAAIASAFFGSVFWMYCWANAMLDSSVDIPFCRPVCIEPS